MAQVQANGIRLEYELSGPEHGLPLLMIHGVGAQLIRWPQALCDALAAAGFRLLRYDSRDIALSTHMVNAPLPNLAEVTAARKAGREPDLPYTLADLADDAAGLLDALGIPAHVVDVSLGQAGRNCSGTESGSRGLFRAPGLAQPDGGQPGLSRARGRIAPHGGAGGRPRQLSLRHYCPLWSTKTA